MSSMSIDSDVFVVGFLPPNTVLEIKKEHSSKEEQEVPKKISNELNSQADQHRSTQDLSMPHELNVSA